jgi:cytochrome P450
MEDSFKFHDGFQLQKGDRFLVPALAIQMDPDNYTDPEKFNGWRFIHYPDGPDKPPKSLHAAAAVDSKYLQ